MSFPVTIASSLISRIKILSRMDIAERRRPQDGRVKMKVGKKRTVDYRVSAVPTVYGERIVMRVLDRASLQIDMTKLGFDGKQLETFKKAITAPYGMILCTGPTGSGKTTTLYSALASLDHGSLNILTSEDPVEYNFPGISQVQVNEQINVTFANVLRSFLRQDPDVIMVGEIRDSETAEICSKAALTGHLVLSTVHTNDAPSAIGRLIDLGLKPYLVSACLNMVIAQRLLRKICLHCKVEITVDRKILIDAGMTESQADTVLLYGGRGCDACGRTGYFGRIGIYEIMPVTRRIKSAVAADLPADQIKDIALSEGMKDLRRAALEKVFSGITTLEEALQNTMVE
jgi:type IV pilus assembly protein PilB